MISAYVDGVGEVAAKLDRLNSRMTIELRVAIARLTIKAQRKVQQEKLSGQVLGVRTGRGKRSIQQDVSVSDTRVTGVVSTNVGYMIGWETGWTGGGGDQGLAAAKGKFAGSGSATNFKNGTEKKRAFLIPTLRELEDSGAIKAETDAAVARAAQ